MRSLIQTDSLARDIEEILGFARTPLSARFCTPSTKDMFPVASWKKEEDGYSTVVRVVGIDPKDLQVIMQNYGLLIKGESILFGEEYSQEIRIGISPSTISNIKKVDYEARDGICKIKVYMQPKSPAYENIKIKRIETVAPHDEEVAEDKK